MSFDDESDQYPADTTAVPQSTPTTNEATTRRRLQTETAGDKRAIGRLRSHQERPITLLPDYLRGIVHPHHGDFYVSASFDPRLVVQLMAEGFLPIATRQYLLPKLHVERSVVRLPNLHTPRSIKKKSKRFTLSINRDFEGVVAGCHAQHGISWLYPRIVSAFRAIHSAGLGGAEALLFEEGTVEPVGTTPVRLYSVEVWNATTRELAAGELGYSVGTVYSSLTGFSAEDSAGSVQLAALGALLRRCGFAMWDLGMDMSYKKKLGAEMMPREQFVQFVRRVRAESPEVVLQCKGTHGKDERFNAKEIIDVEVPLERIGGSPSDTASATEEVHRSSSSSPAKIRLKDNHRKKGLVTSKKRDKNTKKRKKEPKNGEGP